MRGRLGRFIRVGGPRTGGIAYADATERRRPQTEPGKAFAPRDFLHRASVGRSPKAASTP